MNGIFLTVALVCSCIVIISFTILVVVMICRRIIAKAPAILAQVGTFQTVTPQAVTTVATTQAVTDKLFISPAKKRGRPKKAAPIENKDERVARCMRCKQPLGDPYSTRLEDSHMVALHACPACGDLTTQLLFPEQSSGDTL